MYWNIIKDNFKNIIDDNEYYSKKLDFISNYNNNILLYGSYGFPMDLYIDEIIKKKFNIDIIYKTENIWNKSVIYNYNKHFLEIDMMNPNINKDFNNIYKFISNIIKTKHVVNNKHFIIIKHIDLLKNNYYDFRIILERYSNNVSFLCTTHNTSCIEIPIKSRFTTILIKNFTFEDIIAIYSKYLKISINKYLIEDKTTNLVKTLFISEVEKYNNSLVTKQYCTLNYPPLYDFIKEFNKRKDNLENIREFSYKCFQYNITISHIVQDILKIVPNKQKFEIIKIGAEIDYSLCKTNKGREPIYIERLLCQILL